MVEMVRTLNRDYRSSKNVEEVPKNGLHNRKSLLMNVVLHWIDMMAELEFDSLIDIASQHNFKEKKLLY